MHDKPGGLCTSWKRKGYTFDGCIHWLVGSRAGSGFNRIWQELGALQGRQIVDHEEFLRIEGQGGKAFIVYTDVDRLEQHMKALAPADAKVIEEFTNAVRLFTRFSEAMGDPAAPSGLFGGIRTAFKMLPFMRPLAKYSKTSIQDLADRFSDPFLGQAFATVFGMPDFPLVLLLITLAWMHNHDAGYPIGGSLAFAQAIERRYLDLGGQIHYRSRVEKILVENDQAAGVRLTDGTEHRANVVISAADGHATMFDMLEEKYVSDKVRGYYDELPIFQPIVQVSLGVARDLSDEPHMASYPLVEPITVAGEVRKRMGVKHYCYDPTMAPSGKSVVVVSFESNYAYWKDLAQERERYDAEKQQIAIAVIARLEQRFPGITGQVEVVDVATPLTIERYTGNWHGSIEGWLPTTETIGMTMVRGMDKTLPGLENFYMVGQWVEPGGGLPPAAQSGRKVIQMICKRDRRPFVTQVP
jgi:phytoene dehydrogenase-like protein